MISVIPILVLAFAFTAESIQLNETYIDFENTTDSLFYQACFPTVYLFERKQYVNSTFIKPVNTSNFFSTASRSSCVQTELFDPSDKVEIVLHLYRVGLFQYYDTLDVDFTNANNSVLKRTSFTFEKTYTWRYESVSYIPEEPFRIRLAFVSPTRGEYFAIDSIKLNVYKDITTTSAPSNFTECIRDDLSTNSTGFMFSPCLDENFNDFVKLKYSNTSLVEKPLGANDYFLTLPNEGKPACMRSAVNYDVKEGTEVILSIYTDNSDGKINRGFLFAVDPANETIAINMLSIEINNSRKWRRVSMKMMDSARVKLKFQVEDISNSTAFIAIDYVGIKDRDTEDCTTTCQCSTYKIEGNENIDTFASIDNPPSQSFGSTSIIISTTVVVSLLWGGVLFAFIYRRNRNSNNQ